MVTQAREETGLESFGHDPPDEALAVLTDSIGSEARLDDAGLAAARAQLVAVLRNRLVAQEFFDAHPEILERRLGSPVVIIAGGARTGTTVLHRLLGLDPDFATLKTWQVLLEPIPPRGTAPGDEDPRLDRARAAFPPGSSPVHPLVADDTEEEVFYLREAFACLLYHLQWYLPSYEQWLRTTDLEFGYRYLLELLHLNEWRAGTPAGMARVMKSPQYAHDLHFIVRRFPDAKIIFTHRDPLKWVGSFLSIHRGTRPDTYPGIDYRDRSRERLEMLEYEKEHVARVRASEPADRFCDVLYADLQRDPLDVVTQVYGFLGRTPPADLEKNIDTWLAANPPGKGGTHRYTLEEFGLDTDEVDRSFADYRDRFGVPREG